MLTHDRSFQHLATSIQHVNQQLTTRVRTIPSWTPNTQYPILWYLTIPIPNTNTNTGSGVICWTDSLQITTQISVVKGYRRSYTTPGCEIRYSDIRTSTALLTILAFTRRYSSVHCTTSPEAATDSTGVKTNDQTQGRVVALWHPLPYPSLSTNYSISGICPTWPATRHRIVVCRRHLAR